MKKKFLLNAIFIGVLLFSIPGILTAEAKTISDYGHISFVDKTAKVIRQDKTEHAAVVNLPVVPGDQIVTGDDGRCEVQFANGTILRLDRNSRLKVTTILAPTFTTKWKMTTLHLMRGQLYSMNQSYNKEMFQVITPNAAVNLKKRSASTIQLRENGDTFIYADKGKFKVMFGPDVDALKTETIHKGTPYLITADHKLTASKDERDIDFVGFNEYINRNFEDLHEGISKVPAKIHRYPKALVYWAEKWSNLYGEWIYDDLFGYVWKPGDEIFAFSKRPFFHADFIKINGELFLVPQQKWGWIPAHMGTWVWMKWGWTWVPGTAFSTGINSFWTLFSFPSFDYWIYDIYGSYPLYYIYRNRGVSAWKDAYKNEFKVEPKKPSLKKLPDSVRQLIKKMNKTKVAVIRNKLGDHRPTPVIEKSRLAHLLKTKTEMIKSPLIIDKKTLTGESVTNKNAVKPKTETVKTPKTIIKNKQRPAPNSFRLGSRGIGKLRATKLKGFRDFNPDMEWGVKRGFQVGYSSKINAVVLPEQGLDSRTISNRDRSMFRGRSPKWRGTYAGSSGSSSSGSTATTASSSSSSTAQGTRSGRSSGSKGGGGKEK
jgi:hypothetical protein